MCVTGSNDSVSIEAQCNCDAGFTGPSCEDHLCDEVECLHEGKCVIKQIDVNNIQASCDCAYGYDGDSCQIDICNDIKCFNDGNCTIYANDSDQLKAKCSCPDKYIGDQCETVEGCQGDPCQNGSECKLFLNSVVQEYFTLTINFLSIIVIC